MEPPTAGSFEGEDLWKRRSSTEELEMRKDQLKITTKLVSSVDEIVLDREKDMRNLRNWNMHISCRNIPDFEKLNNVNEYLSYWCDQMKDPSNIKGTMDKVLLHIADVIQLINEIKWALESPPEFCSATICHEIGLLLHSFREKQNEFIDLAAYNIIRNINDIYDPELGSFVHVVQTPQITHALWGNMVASPQHSGHKFEECCFKFKIPEYILHLAGIYRVIRFNYDHYSDSSQSYFPPGPQNSLKKSIDNWIKLKMEDLKATELLKEPLHQEQMVTCQSGAEHEIEGDVDGGVKKGQEDQKKGGKAEVHTVLLLEKSNQLEDQVVKSPQLSPSCSGSYSEYSGSGSDDYTVDDEEFGETDKDHHLDRDKDKDKDKEMDGVQMETKNEKGALQGGGNGRVEVEKDKNLTSPGKAEAETEKEEGADEKVEKVEIDKNVDDDENVMVKRRTRRPRRSKSNEKDDQRLPPGEQVEIMPKDNDNKETTNTEHRRRRRPKPKKVIVVVEEEKVMEDSPAIVVEQVKSEVKDKKKEKDDKDKERPKTESEKAKERERAEKAQFIPKTRAEELNLRNYSVQGGVYNFRFLRIPPQERARGPWIIQQSEAVERLVDHSFVADYVPPPPPELQEAKKTPEEMEREAKRQEEELLKLVQIDIDLSKSSCWFEPPIPVRWIEKHRIWSQEGFYDVKFNEYTLQLGLRTDRFGTFGFAHNRWANLPYQSWEIRPKGINKALFNLIAAMAVIEFTVKEDLICVSSLQNLNTGGVVEKALLNKYMKPSVLINRLRYHGLDVFPEEDSYAYVDGILVKDKATENHLYQCMAFTACAFNYHWSRWNLLAGRTKIVYQGRERIGTATPGNYSMILTKPRNTCFIDCTEVSPNYSEEEANPDEFKADMLHLIYPRASFDAQAIIMSTSPLFIESLYTLLSAVRPLSFS